MNVARIPWNKTTLLSKLVGDYMAGNPNTSAFFHTAPNLESIQHFALNRKFDDNARKLLVDVLSSQYNQSGLAIPDNVKLLSNENTFTVTTGHQLCLFGGPAYFIYKIVSTIKLANQLSQKYPKLNFVPVFWMATEDHDVDEIDHVTLHSKSIRATFSKPFVTGRLNTAPAQEALEIFINHLGVSSPAAELANILIKAHKQPNHSQATRAWVHALFQKHGLVIIDGDDSALKQPFLSIVEREINEEITSKEVSITNQNLVTSGYHAQVNPREINLFYLNGGDRNRIIKEQNGGIRTESGLELNIDTLKAAPHDISPNVLLRPVYQEIILPNVAYVGGGGEIAYWLQLKGLFEALNLMMPALVLRDSIAWMHPIGNRWQATTQLNDDELFLPIEAQRNMVLERAGYHRLPFEAEKTALQVALNMVSNKIEAVNPSLEFSAMALKTDTINRFKVLEDKIWREVKKREKEKLEVVNKLRDALLPNGGLAERTESAFNYIGSFATIDKWLDFLLSIANPTDVTIKLIRQA